MANPDDGGQRGAKTYDRNLGVIEALIAVRDQCPMGSVRKVAMLALDAAKEPAREGATSVLREQAYFVLTAIQGWRGERSRQVHRSLQAFLDASTDKAKDKATDKATNKARDQCQEKAKDTTS